MDEACFHWKLFTRIERGDVTAQTVVQISGIRACTMEQPQHAVKNDIIVHPAAYFMANGPHDLDFDALCSIVEPIAKKYGMLRVSIFGSRARGDYRDDSDYDFCVLPPRGMGLFAMGGFYGDLADAIGMKIDVVSENGVRNDFADRISKDLKVLYEA